MVDDLSRRLRESEQEDAADLEYAIATGDRVNYKAVGLTRDELEKFMERLVPMIGRIKPDYEHILSDPNLVQYAVLDMLTLMDAREVETWNAELEAETQAEFQKMSGDKERTSAPPWIMEEITKRAV